MENVDKDAQEERRVAADLKSCVASLDSLDGESVRGTYQGDIARECYAKALVIYRIGVGS